MKRVYGNRGLRRAGTLASASLLVVGCTVGPDFKTPELARPVDPAGSFTPVPVPAYTASAAAAGGASQRFVKGQDIPAAWWRVFRSVPLDQLIRSALELSPTLASAEAALRQARETYEATAGSTLVPKVYAEVGVERKRLSQLSSRTSGGIEYTAYAPSLNVSYTFDAFGGNRRLLEGLRAAVDYQSYQFEAAVLTLTANVVTTAIQEASLRAQLKATQEVIDAESNSLTVIQKQAALGSIAKSTVLQQQALLAQTHATVPALEKALAQTRHQLAVLAGRLPGEQGLPEFDLDALHLPDELPLSLPSELTRQRPDVRASEALLHQASAQVGVATANLYPQFSLSASYGSESSTISKLFTPATTTWSLAGGLVQPIFDAGALQAKRRAALDAYDQAQAQYQQTALNAFLGVANALRALESDANALRAQVRAESLARQSLDLVTRQYQLGAVSSLGVLDSQRTYQQTRLALVQAQAARYADTAALFQALGGGWWNRSSVDISSAARQ